MYNLLDWKFVHQQARREHILRQQWLNFILGRNK